MGTVTGENRADDARLARHIIARPRVMRLLDESDARVRILAAPAGYGKTTAARQWLLGSNRVAAWYETNSASTDIAALAAGIAGRVAELVPGAATLVRERLQARRDTKAIPELLAEALVADLGTWPEDAWIVVDDYQHLMSASTAERFIEQLARSKRLQLLLLTRRRPTWLTARQLLYGEVSEFGAHALAMTSEEAALVLTTTRSEAVSGLVALAHGWPAVIGLAALTTSSLSGLNRQLPETLHAYFAEELYQAAPPDLQEAMLTLTFAPTITTALADALFDNRGDETLCRATEYGFLTTIADLRYDLHPLLRQFLLTKTHDRHEHVERWCNEISNFLAAQQAWDDLFALQQMTASPGAIDALVLGALGDFLHEGRVETVRRWVSLARAQGFDSPAIDLAEAEVLFREGLHLDSENRALRAAEGFQRGHLLRSRALYRAAQSAQLDNRASTAIPRHEEAERTALSSSDRRNAIWGQFVAHAELDNRDAAMRAAADYRKASSPSADDRLRQAHAKTSVAIRWGGVREALQLCRQCVPLLEEPADPLIQTGFAQMAASAFVLAADYDNAINVAILEERIATRVGLEFVFPHVCITRATAHIGRAEFGDARKWLTDARIKANALGDEHSAINARMLDAKLMLSQLNAEGARETLDVDWETWPTRGLGAEYMAMQAFASACTGDRAGCERALRLSEGLASQLEADALRAWAIAVVSHRRTRSDEPLKTAFRHTHTVGHLDSVILAYRSYPPVVPVLARDEEALPRVKEVIVAGRDYGLAKRARIRLSIAPQDVPRILTARELDVARLIHAGLSNAEIAKALWISESTTKVHVRNILRKLGVRTRTEAAVRAAPYFR